jgi:Fe-S cluster biogenesis protein NfuA
MARQAPWSRRFTRRPSTSSTRTGEERLQRVLDEEVNPAVAAHGGRVILVGVVAGRAHVRLEGRCQGCSLAEVTVRRGIEGLCRARLPEIVAVLDVTDHSAGADPFYTSAKR